MGKVAGDSDRQFGLIGVGKGIALVLIIYV